MKDWLLDVWDDARGIYAPLIGIVLRLALWPLAILASGVGWCAARALGAIIVANDWIDNRLIGR